MKKFTNNMKLIVVSLLIVAPFMISSVWKKTAKPTFKERVMMEVEAGKKVAVFTNLTSVGYRHTATSDDGLCKIGKGFSTAPQGAMTTYSYLAQLGEDTPAGYDISNTVADQLNKGMGTDAFVAVAQDAIESKTIKALGVESKVQDWWGSDYDIIVEITLASVYETAQSANPFKTSLTVSPLMYVREVVEGKEALGFLVNGRSLGNSSTAAVEHNDCYSSLDDLKANVSAPDALISQAKEGVAEPLAKFIEKENAKYDKAMKKKKKKS